MNSWIWSDCAVCLVVERSWYCGSPHLLLMQRSSRIYSKKRRKVMTRSGKDNGEVSGKKDETHIAYYVDA